MKQGCFEAAFAPLPCLLIAAVHACYSIVQGQANEAGKTFHESHRDCLHCGYHRRSVGQQLASDMKAGTYQQQCAFGLFAYLNCT